MKVTQNKKIIISLAAIVAVAALGSVFVSLGMDRYDALKKPSEFIPDQLVPVMWTVIYSIFAVVCFIGFKSDAIKKPTVILLAVNGALNVLWCLTFFTFGLLLLGNIVIILNLIAAFILVIFLYGTKRVFSYVTSIYPVWLAIAATLNTALWILN